MSQPENAWNTGFARDYVLHAFINGVEVVKPIFLARAKGDSDVDQMLSRNQIMYASKNNTCVDIAHIDSLLPLLQGIQYYVNHNHGVRLLVITVLHGDAFTNGSLILP